MAPVGLGLRPSSPVSELIALSPLDSRVSAFGQEQTFVSSQMIEDESFEQTVFHRITADGLKRDDDS